MAVKERWAIDGETGVSWHNAVILKDRNGWTRIAVTMDAGDSYEVTSMTWKSAVEILESLNDIDGLRKSVKSLTIEIEKTRTDVRMMRVALEQEKARRTQ